MEAEPMIKQENSNSLLMDDDQTHVVITGPPASRTVIDNLKKLLTQRQHSRESDAENKEVVPSTGSDLESELSFYSLLTSSTSDSDLDFLRTSPDNRKSKRRPKRNLSTSSSSSSSSLSPVRERRKRPKTSKRGVKRFDSQMIILEDWNPQSMTPKRTPPIGISRHSPISQLVDSADPLTNGASIVNINIMMNPNVKFNGDQENPSSSNKESTTDEEDQGIASMDKSTKNNGSARGTRLRKTRRDRNKRRKHHHHHHHHHHHPLNHDQRDKNRYDVNYHQLHVSNSNVELIGTEGKAPTNNIPMTNPSSPTKQLQLLPADLTQSQGPAIPEPREDSTPAEAHHE